MLYDFTTLAADSIRSLAADALNEGNRLVAAAIGGPPTYEGTLAPLNDMAGIVGEAFGRLAFMGRVHPDPAVRAAGNGVEEKLSKWTIDLAFNEDLYRAVTELSSTEAAKDLSGERRRLLDHWLRDFRRAGHDLAKETRAEVRRLRQRLVELEVQFQKNLDAWKDGLELTRADLEGLPDEYIASLRFDKGTYLVSLDYPEYFPFMRQARNRELRRQLSFKRNTSVPENRPLLEEAVNLRARIAALFGLDSWSHFAMEVKMAKEPAAVEQFYKELVPPLERLAAAERQAMRALLESDHPGATLSSWDAGYYDNEMRKRDFGLDANEVAEYFPLQQVIDGMFAITGEVFGLRYEKLDETGAWHPDVELYRIIDARSGEVVAHFYADWFPRDGKFGHAAAFNHVLGHAGDQGEYVRPVGAIVANFTKPSSDRPSLLKHDEVTTLFHEFGHILHLCLTTAELVRFSGFQTEGDFVEAPSQIMEHWCWNVDALSRFARHYRTGDPIPRDLVNRMVAARNLNEATSNLRQVYFGSLDLALHGSPPIGDLDEINRRTQAVTGFPFQEGTFFPASFGHLMGGYDAGYYGYLWSKVFGDDMFSVFEHEGVLSPVAGKRYREKVLAPGGSRDAGEILSDFLGREPNNDAFLRYLGLGLPATPTPPVPGAV